MAPARFWLLLSLGVFGLAFDVDRTAIAQDKPAIEFPDVDGWVKNVRYDPPHVPATSMAYTTKNKIGGDYIRVQVTIPESGGKTVKEARPDIEKKIAERPIHTGTKLASAKELGAGKKTKVTQLIFNSTYSSTPTETMLFVFPYDKYLIMIEHHGPSKDHKLRLAESLKLVEALAKAAEN